MIKNLSRILMLLALGCSSLASLAASNTPSTQGTVKDKYGEPIMGAVVYDVETGKSIGTTNGDGVFTAPLSFLNKKVRISYIGYKTEETELTTDMDVELPFDNHYKNQKIALGNALEVDKQDFAGAADIVMGTTIDRQPIARLVSGLQGNLPGVAVTEGQTETSLETFNLRVRGLSTPHGNEPLYVIDGVVMYPGTHTETIMYITPSEIESLVVLKDATSQAVYGGQGANGVVVITTKRGTAGKPRVGVYLDASMNTLGVTPDYINSYRYAKLRNEAAYNDGLGKNYYYSDEQLEGYRTHADPYLYPDNNWRSMLMRKWVLMQRAAFDVSGGNDWVNYYVNANVLHDGGAFHTEDNKDRLGDNSYNPNTNYFWVNFRSNVEAKVTNWLTARLNLSGNIKREHMSYGGRLAELYPTFFNISPATYGPTTPYTYNDDGTINLDADYPGGQVIVTDKDQKPAWAELNRTGYKHYQQTNVNGVIDLTANLSMITKGLSVGGSYGFHTYMQRQLYSRMTTYEKYQLDTNAETFTFKQYGTDQNANMQWGSTSQSYFNANYRGHIDYERQFGLHGVRAQGFGYLEHYETGNMPYEFINFGIDATYNFDHRYVLRAVVTHSASDYFSRSSRWQTLPAVSVAWNAHNEAFVKEAAPWLTNAKLRFSIGKTGNVTGISSIGRYSYEDVINYATSGGSVYNNQLITEGTSANPNLKPEMVKKWDVGVDLGFLNMIDFRFDVFKEKTTNYLIRQTLEVPEYQGAPLESYPYTNSGHFRNSGFETQLQVTKKYRDWGFSVGGYFSWFKNKVIYSGETYRGDDYVYPYRTQGFEYGKEFGWIIDTSNGNGYFNFPEEVAEAPEYSMGTPRVGDFKYKDLNGDGKIDTKDQAPFASNGNLPRYFYGFNGLFTYKNWELSFMFQGVGKYKRESHGFFENQHEGVFVPLHEHAWTQDRWNNDEEVRYPALTVSGSNTSHQYNNYFVLNRAYLKLKTAEIAYTLPLNISKKFHCERFKVYINGNNLLVFDHLKKGLKSDPEKDFYALPFARTYNIGIRASF